MSVYSGNPLITAAEATSVDRAGFIRRTYIHLAGAILAFIGIESVLLPTPLGASMTNFIVRQQFGWLLILGVIVCGIVFGFDLGLVFSAVMVLFAGASILYTTSNIIHHYRTDQHVAASLALFAGVMLLLWYVLRILMSRR